MCYRGGRFNLKFFLVRREESHRKLTLHKWNRGITSYAHVNAASDAGKDYVAPNL